MITAEHTKYTYICGSCHFKVQGNTKLSNALLKITSCPSCKKSGKMTVASFSHQPEVLLK